MAYLVEYILRTAKTEQRKLITRHPPISHPHAHEFENNLYLVAEIIEK